MLKNVNITKSFVIFYFCSLSKRWFWTTR